MRINARLDEAAARQVTELTTATGQSVSHVVREAIARYHREVRGERVGLRHFAAMVGKGDSGRTDIASNYKKYVAEAIEAKHGLRSK
jgi:hypothetical protein